MKKAIVFGGYCPLHRGHLDVILRAKKECDHVTLIVCGYDGEPRGLEIGCPLEMRTTLISEYFRDDEQITVTSINDTLLGLDESMSPENWKVWTEEAERLAGTNEVVYYVAEPFYRSRLALIKKDVVLMHRDLEISGTEIREHPVKYWDYITPPFRQFLTSKILITGTASEGKTTLCKDIARYFNIPWIPEYGKRFLETSGVTDDKLTYEHFKGFIENQFKGRPWKEKLWISDTDNLVTLMYAKAYAHRNEMAITIEDYKRLKSCKMFLPKWTKIFMVPPHSEKFIDDGTRYMAQSDMDERKKNYEILKDLMNEYGYEYEELKGNYYENFLRVKEYIETI